MYYLLAAILVVLIAGIALILWFLKNKLGGGEVNKNDASALVLIQNQIGEIVKTVDAKLSDSSRMTQMGEATRNELIRSVTEHLTKLQESNKQVLNFTDQLKNLQDILKNPKQRGVLGEYFLETLLKNVLPPDKYQMQYKFQGGVIVDAVVFVKDKIIPVDSKFSLENYNRLIEENDPIRRAELEKVFKQDLKNRIDETSKYIKPEEGTMDFAFMFIPAEGIYYDLLINKVGAVKSNTQDLIQYAFREKHVIIVSPTSFLAYLQTVLQGLKALQIEESTKEIIKKVVLLDKHLKNVDVYMDKLGNNLKTTVNAFNFANKELVKVDKDILKITGESSGIELQSLQGPEIGEE